MKKILLASERNQKVKIYIMNKRRREKEREIEEERKKECYLHKEMERRKLIFEEIELLKGQTTFLEMELVEFREERERLVKQVEKIKKMENELKKKNIIEKNSQRDTIIKVNVAVKNTEYSTHHKADLQNEVIDLRTLSDTSTTQNEPLLITLHDEDEAPVMSQNIPHINQELPMYYKAEFECKDVREDADFRDKFARLKFQPSPFTHEDSDRKDAIKTVLINIHSPYKRSSKPVRLTPTPESQNKTQMSRYPTNLYSSKQNEHINFQDTNTQDVRDDSLYKPSQFLSVKFDPKGKKRKERSEDTSSGYPYLSAEVPPNPCSFPSSPYPSANPNSNPSMPSIHATSCRPHFMPPVTDANPVPYLPPVTCIDNSYTNSPTYLYPTYTNIPHVRAPSSFPPVTAISTFRDESLSSPYVNFSHSNQSRFLSPHHSDRISYNSTPLSSPMTYSNTFRGEPPPYPNNIPYTDSYHPSFPITHTNTSYTQTVRPSAPVTHTNIYTETVHPSAPVTYYTNASSTNPYPYFTPISPGPPDPPVFSHARIPRHPVNPSPSLPTYATSYTQTVRPSAPVTHTNTFYTQTVRPSAPVTYTNTSYIQTVRPSAPVTYTNTSYTQTVRPSAPVTYTNTSYTQTIRPSAPVTHINASSNQYPYFTPVSPPDSPMFSHARIPRHPVNPSSPSLLTYANTSYTNSPITYVGNSQVNQAPFSSPVTYSSTSYVNSSSSSTAITTSTPPMLTAREFEFFRPDSRSVVTIHPVTDTSINTPHTNP